MRKTVLKNILLLLASLVFYAWGEPIYIVLLLVSIAANYGIGLLLGCQRDESVAAKTVLAAGILVNLGILGYYKYFDFFLRIVNRLTGSEHEMRNIPLPIGISFFTFGAISYLMDLYRGHYEAEKNPLNFSRTDCAVSRFCPAADKQTGNRGKDSGGNPALCLWTW